MTTLAARVGALAETTALPDPGPIADGEARCLVEHFALTANNVTYAVHGEDFAYWRFFPAPEGHGIVPVWGFARVSESRAEGISVGQRFFGYWPMGAQAVLTPVQVSAHGFTDGAAHRGGLPPFYSRYNPASPAWGDEALQCLFRPLYATSFLIDCLVASRPVDTLLLSSASSKTALGVAQAAKGRQRVVGLTSPGAAFTNAGSNTMAPSAPLFSILTVISLAAAGAAITRAAATKPRIFIGYSPRAGGMPAGFSHARAGAPDRLEAVFTRAQRCTQDGNLRLSVQTPFHEWDIGVTALSPS